MKVSEPVALGHRSGDPDVDGACRAHRAGGGDCGAIDEVTLVAALEPKATVEGEVKFEPLMVTAVPTPRGPVSGETPVTVGKWVVGEEVRATGGAGASGGGDGEVHLSGCPGWRSGGDGGAAESPRFRGCAEVDGRAAC